MIILIILFVVIVLVSFFLAMRSMQSYNEMPIHSQVAYSQYLIKNEASLNEELLARLYGLIGKRRLIVSLERLCKGAKKALVIYGPVVILKQFTKELNLVELEDYCINNSQEKSILSWEISSKKFQKNNRSVLGFTDISKSLLENEEFWWQLVLQPKIEKHGSSLMFKTLIRVVMLSSSDQKNMDLKQSLDKMIKDSSLLSLPQAYSSRQIFQFYQQRSLPQNLLGEQEGHFLISAGDVKYLLS